MRELEVVSEPTSTPAESSLESIGSEDYSSLRQRLPEAVERWFQDHSEAIYNYVYYRAGRDEFLTEDVVHDTFISALKQMNDFDPKRGSMRIWLLLRARNCLRNYQRRSARDVHVDESIEHGDEPVFQWNLDRSPLPTEVLEKKEISELIDLTLNALSGRNRRLLLQRYAQGILLIDMARSEGISESAMKSALHRARESFRVAWQTIQKNGEYA